MKFTGIAFIIGLCVVAVTANAIGNFKIDPEDFQLDSQEFSEDLIEFEARSTFYFTLIKVLKTLKGLNYAIKEVVIIHNAASQLIDDIKACGGEVSQKVQNLINACNDVVDTSKAILGINQSVCGNDVQSRTWHVVAGAQNAHKCFVEIFNNMRKLNKQVKTVAKMITQIKKVPGDTSRCVLDSIDALTTHFTDFPTNVKACSKLTSN
ncbi:hypothetical protein DOY81_007996 [Sarcophaga bullata]|nr:hypothetical protein DOY81_007996 [Sarcophaga bullata]